VLWGCFSDALEKLQTVSRKTHHTAAATNIDESMVGIRPAQLKIC
jgi:hypothetical protein